MTVDDIDALIDEAQGTKNKLNGLEKIPETVDEVIEVLFDGWPIVARNPFNEDHACQCDAVQFEYYHDGRKEWVVATEPECATQRMDIPGLNGGSYSDPRRTPSDSEPWAPPVAMVDDDRGNLFPSGRGAAISEQTLSADEFRPVRPEYEGMRFTNAGGDGEGSLAYSHRERLLRERAERLNNQTASLEDAHSRWATSRRVSEEVTQTLRRAGISPRHAARILGGRDFAVIRRMYLEGDISTPAFEEGVRNLIWRFVGEIAPRPGEPISEGLDEDQVQVTQDGPGRWHVTRRGTTP